MRGSLDLVVGSDWSRTLARTSQRGELVEIAGKPHAVHHSDPTSVTAAIVRFIRQSERQPQAPTDGDISPGG